jgi:predicted transglutaminase-like cysteine proteinase
MKLRDIVLTSIGLFAFVCLTAENPANAGSYLPTGAAAVPPAGFIGFCVKHLQDCIAKPQEPAAVELTDDRRSMLETVQYDVNTSLRPRIDPSHAWEYPTDGTADCNKYALSKRRELIAKGWPRSALLLATATTETGEGHLVLVARTNKGDLVLDNRVSHVVDWSYLPYRWISVQSQQSPVRWMSVLSQPIATADAGSVIRSATPTVAAAASATAAVITR